MTLAQYEKNLQTLISDREKIKNIHPNKETPILDDLIETATKKLREKLNEQWQGR